MCGRVYETYTDQELYLRYIEEQALPDSPLATPVYNLCPTMTSPVLRLIDGGRHFDLMSWQLIPQHELAFKTKLSTINARSEGIFNSSLYGDLVIRQRCIIPISGFFEWKREGSQKRPFKIYLCDEPIMSVAGIWDTWRRGRTEERSSFSILTTSANSFMSTIHDRMPVILGRSDEQDWLDPEIHEPDSLKRFLKPCPGSWLTAMEVSSLVNSAKNNTPEVLEPPKIDSRPSLLFD